jgi:hypothetical protein
MVLRFLRFEVFDALLEVLGYELKVGGGRGQESAGVVLGSEGTIGSGLGVGFAGVVLLFLKLFGVYVGVALPSSGLDFDQVGDLFAKHPQIHMSVKINNYNLLIIMESVLPTWKWTASVRDDPFGGVAKLPKSR